MRFLLSAIIMLIASSASAQSVYTINLKPERWEYNPGGFHIAGVSDARKANSIGKVMKDGKITPAIFPKDFDAAIGEWISASAVMDTNSTPVTVLFREFELDASGTQASHRLVLDYAVEFRKGDLLLFEISGSPEMTMKGPYPAAPEQLITSSLKRTLETFRDWLAENPDQPGLAEKVKVVFMPASKQSSGSDTIFWSQGYKLKWTDFKGKTDGSSYSALSNCMFVYKVLPETKKRTLYLNVGIQACFSRSTSWVKKGEEKAPLLQHEQLHFDICELHIRKLRKKLSEAELSPANSEQVIRTMFNDTWNEYQSAQERYDDETQHGTKPLQQEKWNRQVRDELLELEEFMII